MQEWWISLSVVEQVLWGLAVFFTVLFLLQIIAALFGLSHDSHTTYGDISYDFAPSMFFTLRNAIVFFLGFSWGGLACIDTNISILWAVLVGLIMVAINLLLLRGLASLNEAGNLNLDNAIGKEAVVSIPIPEKLGGCGKVNISFQGRLEELEAMTEDDAIPRGQPVKVLRVSNNSQFIVTHLITKD
ncbi:MAG: hypothetical protein DRR16_01975 [Candidatus Parabeggiatoa sp. nov. 3]|nr:MAG: hypothetical protein DRR00_19215 [Gammaproteobacteria bacterium]RKZ64734.1 MAG: hypothetical protein DRQ99_14825 [Gammaproteobacteria bacterium]RKZ89693.1 MAG: hypothetical protein DRR16_01975 [Gammaproteobacteria bacterium]